MLWDTDTGGRARPRPFRLVMGRTEDKTYLVKREQEEYDHTRRSKKKNARDYRGEGIRVLKPQYGSESAGVDWSEIVIPNDEPEGQRTEETQAHL